MRLTLRTLLAYLDDILDPEDARQLQSKIEDSEFATSLVHQIRGSVRRLRLDAPALDAQGIGGDLNSVAEYLDNVLPPEHVPALEKACLDTEVNLSEVASCHQILTLVLGEPADVSEQMRQRAYDIAPTVQPGELPSHGTHLTSHPAHSDVPPPQVPQVTPSPASTPPVEVPTPPAPEAVPPTTAPVAEAPSPSPPATQAPSVATPPIAPQDTPRPKRPSERFKPPMDVPSTREAWRAEAEEGLEPEVESPEIQSPRAPEVQAVDSPLAAVPTAKPLPLSDSPISMAAAGEFPEYLDRKSSWVRSAFITGLVALLILAGLLFATQPLDNNLFSRWFGGSGELLVDQPPTQPLDSQTTLAEPQRKVEIVEATTAPSWVDPPPSKLDELGSSSTTLQPIPDSDDQTDSIPDLVTDSRFSDSPLGAADGSDVTTTLEIDPAPLDSQTPVTPKEDEVVGVSEPTLELLPTIEPEDQQPRKDQSLDVAGDGPQSLTLDREPAVGDVAVDQSLPPKDKVAEVPPAPTFDPEANLERATSSTNVPLPSTDVPLVSAKPDLETAPVDPPVASPAADAVESVASTSRLPVEVESPAEPETRSLETTRLRSEDQLLLVFDKQISDWTRVDSTIPLEGGDVLMGLPAFRADIEIGSSIVCSMINATQLRLGPEADVSLDYGQLLVRSDEAGARQGVRFQERAFNVEVVDADGVVAFEAGYHRIPGSDVAELPHSLFKIYAIKSDIRVQFKDDQFDVAEGSCLTVMDDYPTRVAPFTEKPTWTKSTWRTTADTNAVRLLMRNLNQSQNIRSWLMERASNRRYNERALAARCLAEMDEFSTIIAALDSSEQHAFWDQHFGSLQRALTRSGETTDKLRIELEKAHGEKASFMMEMLQGFSDAQIRGGAAAKLVKYLDHRSLDHRVLAFQNLKQITGMTLAFEPHTPIAKRRNSVRKWKGRLASGQVAYKKVPPIVALLESFEAEREDAGKDAG